MRRLVFECSYVYASVRYKIWHNITQRKSSPRVGSFNGSKRESVSGSVMSDSWQSHGLQHARLLCPSPTPRAMIDIVPEELWTEVCDIVQEAWLKTILKEKECKKTWLSEETLQIAVNRREAKGKGEKERYTHLNADFPKNSKER